MMHPVDLPDAPAPGQRYALIGIAIFVLLLVGACLYLKRKLPKRDDEDDLPVDGRWE